MQLSKGDIRRLRRAMVSAGRPAFFHTFRRLIHLRVGFDTFLLLRFDTGQTPVLLDSWFDPAHSLDDAMRTYVESVHPFDPFFQHNDVPASGGLYRLPDIAPDRFFSSQYYNEYYRAAGLCDEVGLLAPLPGGRRAHLSFSRRDTTGPFRRREIQCLRHHAPLLLELLRQHVSVSLPPAPRQSHTPTPALPELIRAHTATVLKRPVTEREAQIAALVLQGHSNGSAALTLGISRETCKVHRRNLYRKLAIASQRDLFGLLKHLL